MIRLVQRKLIIPRGDTGTFSVPVISTLNTGDVAVFTIIDMKTKRKVYEKIIDATPDTISIRFEHSDTVNLPVGRYYWDIKFYQNPEWADNELINGTEVDSYYAAYSLPECEIRLTGDNLLTADDSPTTTITPYYLNVLNATVNDVNHAKTEITELANAAEASANNANEAATRAQEQADSIKQLSATITMLGTNDAPTSVYNSETGVLSLGIPAPNSIFGILKTSEDGLVDTYTISYTNGTSTTFTVTNGMIPNLTIGTVQEGATAAASITGTAANPILNLTLPNANVPTKVSELENDAGYLTEHQDLSDYVQKTDYASADNAGVVKVDTDKGIKITNNTLEIAAPQNSVIKSGQGINKPVVVQQQHRAVFYGLAKAAGDSTQSTSDNAVGTYTDEAKSAIQTMLDVPSTSDIPTNVSDLTNDAGYLTEETDPTVPAWAKAATKPTYTALEVGAVSRTGDLMTGTLNVKSGNNIVHIGADTQMLQGAGTFISSDAIAFQWESGSGTTYRNVEIKRATPTKLQLSQNYTSGKNVIVSGVDTPVDNTDAANKGYVDEAIAQINTMNIHICAQGEYGTDGVPTIQNPDTQIFYLVPGGEGNNLFIEWAYVNGAWERFGSADVEVPVTDVQVNGVSVLSDGVANVPVAGASTLGVVKYNSNGISGVTVNAAGQLSTVPATVADVKAGTSGYKPIVPYRQGESAFYGLSKAAGVDLKNETVTFGTYPETSKTAIKEMLGVQDGLKVMRLI